MASVKLVCRIEGIPIMYDSDRLHYFLLGVPYPFSTWRSRNLLDIAKAIKRRLHEIN